MIDCTPYFVHKICSYTFLIKVSEQFACSVIKKKMLQSDDGKVELRKETGGATLKVQVSSTSFLPQITLAEVKAMQKESLLSDNQECYS